MAKGAYIGVEKTIYLNSLGDVAVGSTVKINENGVPVDYLVVHQGLPSAKYDASCDGTWVLRKDCYQAIAWDSTDGDYENSDIHAYLNSTFLSLFDANVQSVIKQAKIPYTKGLGTTGLAVSGANGLSTKAFLLCGQEINVTTSDGSALKEDASVLAYFVNAGNSERIAYMDGEAQYWALRTGAPQYNDYICRVRTIGDVQQYPANSQRVIRPALILPSGLSLTNGVVTGAYAESVTQGVARKIKKGYIGVENFVPRALPEGYTQLSHIEATGAQCFDTGFKPNQDTRVVMDFQMTSSAASQFVFGCRTASYTDNFIMLISSANNSFRSGYGSSLIGFSISDLTKRYSIDHNKTVCKIGEQSVTHSAQTFQSSLTMFLCAVNEGGTAKYFAKMKLPPCQIYDNGTLVRDYVPCKNVSGVVGLYDMVNGTFGGSSTSTEFVAGSSVQSVARKIKKAYIGIGGVARPCWSGGELAYYGTITELQYPRKSLSATCNGDYAIFGTGIGSGITSVYEAYNKTLTKNDVYATGKYMYAATSIGKYALFGGGYDSRALQYVEGIDTALTRVSVPDLSAARYMLAATTVGNYALFAGGRDGNYETSKRSDVDAYDTSLVKTTPTALGTARANLLGGTVGNYAIFYSGDASYGIDVYDNNLTKQSGLSISAAELVLQEGDSATLGNYVIFAGVGGGVGRTIVYDSSLTRHTVDPLSSARTPAATVVEEFALFGGGGSLDTVDVYDNSLTRTTTTPLSKARNALAATTIGNYGLFGGGEIYDYSVYKTVYFATVDAYTVA